MTEQFNVETRLENGFTVISLSGELDAESNAAETQLLEMITYGSDAILIDCEELSYISSAGVGVFLALEHACRRKKASITFVNLQPKIKDVLQLIGLSRIFRIADSLEEAMQLYTSQQTI